MDGMNERSMAHSGLAEDIMHLSRLLFQRNAHALEKLNIGVGQIPIMQVLYDSGVLTQREIADRIRVTPATISDTIKRMENARFVSRFSNETDARVSFVQLTDTGRTCFEAATRAMDLPYGEMLEGFSESEVNQFHNFIRRMDGNMTRLSEKANGEE